MRKIISSVWVLVLAALAACGGGGGGGGGGGSTTTSAAPAATTSPTPVAPGANVQPIVVALTSGSTVNQAFTSVTLCAPGSASNCQTINNVFVDTGSSGLRIVASVLSAALAPALTQQNDASGNPIVECAQFVDGFSWGPVKIADMQIAGERANSLPIQVIGDAAFPASAIPASCSGTGQARNSVAQLHANGILGVGMFRQDCGSACALRTTPGIYFVCPASGCQPALVSQALQVQNPVAMFPVDNNGVMVQLPAVAAAGATTASGSLVFGIGTQTNNGLGSASVVGVSASTGHFATLYNGAVYNASFVDSGSNALFFGDPSIPVCSGGAAPGFFCPFSTQTGFAVIQGTNGASASVSFSVANANALIGNNPSFAAFSNLAAPQFVASTFDWGLPFFFGRNVYSAISGASTPAGTGPYIAF